MQTASRVAKNNRARGASTQSEVKSLIIGAFPALDGTDVRSTSRGAQGEDIQLSNHARVFLPYQIEVKRQKKCTPCRWMEQAQTHGSWKPLVIFREDRGEFMVCLHLKEFLHLRQNYKRPSVTTHCVEQTTATTEEFLRHAAKVMIEHADTLEELAKR